MSQKGSEKDHGISHANDHSGSSMTASKSEGVDDSHEVFRREEGAVDFRTVGWIHASVIFLKRLSPQNPHNPQKNFPSFAALRR